MRGGTKRQNRKINKKRPNATINYRTQFKLRNNSESQNKYLKRVRDFLFHMLITWENSGDEQVELIMFSVANKVSDKFTESDLDIDHIDSIKNFSGNANNSSDYIYDLIKVLKYVMLLPAESRKRREFKNTLEHALNLAFDEAHEYTNPSPTAHYSSPSAQNPNVNELTAMFGNSRLNAAPTAAPIAAPTAVPIAVPIAAPTNGANNSQIDDLMKMFKTIL